MHPLISSRLAKGSFVTLYSDLHRDEIKFVNYLRMSMMTVNELLTRISYEITHIDVFRVVTPAEQLAVLLRYVSM